MGDDAGIGMDRGVGVVGITGVGGAVVGARIHVHGTALVGGNAEVGHATVIQVLGLQEHRVSGENLIWAEGAMALRSGTAGGVRGGVAVVLGADDADGGR